MLAVSIMDVSCAVSAHSDTDIGVKKHFRMRYNMRKCFVYTHPRSGDTVGFIQVINLSINYFINRRKRGTFPVSWWQVALPPA